MWLPSSIRKCWAHKPCRRSIAVPYTRNRPSKCCCLALEDGGKKAAPEGSFRRSQKLGPESTTASSTPLAAALKAVQLLAACCQLGMNSQSNWVRTHSPTGHELAINLRRHPRGLVWQKDGAPQLQMLLTASVLLTNMHPFTCVHGASTRACVLASCTHRVGLASSHGVSDRHKQAGGHGCFA